MGQPERKPSDEQVSQLAERIFGLDQGIESPVEDIQVRGSKGQQVFGDGKVLKGVDLGAPGVLESFGGSNWAKSTARTFRKK